MLCFQKSTKFSSYIDLVSTILVFDQLPAYYLRMWNSIMAYWNCMTHYLVCFNLWATLRLTILLLNILYLHSVLALRVGVNVQFGNLLRKSFLCDSSLLIHWPFVVIMWSLYMLNLCLLFFYVGIIIISVASTLSWVNKRLYIIAQIKT